MAHFLWKGYDIDGASHEGALEAASLEMARNRLIQTGFFKCSFRRISEPRLHKPLSLAEISSFLMQLQRLLKSGVELDDALGFAISEQKEDVLSYLFCRIREDLREGQSLSTSLNRFPVFPTLVVKLIEVSENSGRMIEILGILLDFFQYQHKVMQEQKRLLNYPLVVFGIFLVMTFGSAVFMVPMFKRMYVSMGDELFWMTRFLVQMSDSLRFYPEYWIFGICILAMALWLLSRRVGWFWLMRMMPGGKRLNSTISMLFYSKALEIMLRSGVHLRQALTLAEEMFPALLRDKLTSVRFAVESGKTLKDAYSENVLFSPLFVQMVSLGESTGHLSSSFERISTQNQEALEKMMAWIHALIEPVVMILIALGVLGFLLSMYLPLFKMAENF